MTPNLSPDLNLYGEHELMDMLAQNRADGLAPDPEQTLASSHLGQVAANIMQTALPDTLVGVNPEFKAQIAVSQELATQLFEPLGLVTPTTSELETQGIDFKRLNERYAAMEAAGAEPELVLAPSLALAEWRTVFKNLQDDPSVNTDGRIKNDGLWLADDVANNWDSLMNQADNGTTATTSDGTQWHVALVPGTPKPSVVSIDAKGKDSSGNITPLLQARNTAYRDVPLQEATLHPTIADYLTLQAGRLAMNQLPVDSETYTWLQGTFRVGNDLRAPRGFWLPDVGRVGLYWDEVDLRVDYLGVRLPVWG
jgi:hypothetical protein